MLALNKREDYKAGGTQFVLLDGTPTFRPKRGHATLFSGKNRHQGLAITAGTRYVLAGFLKYTGGGEGGGGGGGGGG